MYLTLPTCVRRKQFNEVADDIYKFLLHISIIMFLFSQLMWSNDGRHLYVFIVHLSQMLLGCVGAFGIIDSCFARSFSVNAFHAWLLTYCCYFMVSVIWAESMGYSKNPLISLLKMLVFCMIITLQSQNDSFM